jgi:hypothetical protein
MGSLYFTKASGMSKYLLVAIVGMGAPAGKENYICRIIKPTFAVEHPLSRVKAESDHFLYFENLFYNINLDLN